MTTTYHHPQLDIDNVDDLPPPIVPGSTSHLSRAEVMATAATTQGCNNNDEDEGQQVKCLKEQGFSSGLARSLLRMKKEFPLRIWVVDNSGSMTKDDGRRIVETTRKNDVRLVRCTRWDELCECVKYHVQMAALLHTPTRFRLLNAPGASAGPQYFGIAEMTGESTSMSKEVNTAIQTMERSRPYGVTPLAEHVADIYNQVFDVAPRLRRNGQKVVVVIATDGLPSDDRGHGGRLVSDQFVRALRMLGALPVWVVIRLCTDDDSVVEFYERLDTDLELSLELLDDFVDEAREVHRCNPWLTYALPLHRCREMGFYDRIFDLLDERLLTKGELFEFCSILFGDAWDGVPDPLVNWNGFVRELKRIVKNEERQWNPVLKKVMPWIDLKELERAYGSASAWDMRVVLLILAVVAAFVAQMLSSW